MRVLSSNARKDMSNWQFAAKNSFILKKRTFMEMLDELRTSCLIPNVQQVNAKDSEMSRIVPI